MKMYICLAFFLSNILNSQAQIEKDSSRLTDSLLTSGSNYIFTNVEYEAAFPGADNAWASYLQANLDADTPVKNKAKRGTYKVIIRFIVKKDGTISDVVAETNFGHGMEAECIRVIKNGPKWIPAYQNGRKVNAYRRQPVTFLVR